MIKSKDAACRAVPCAALALCLWWRGLGVWCEQGDGTPGHKGGTLSCQAASVLGKRGARGAWAGRPWRCHRIT